MAMLDIVGRGLASVGLVIVAGIATAAAEEIRDWPCAEPLAERFVPEAVWGGPLPGPLPDGWRDDDEVREVVEFAANPENPPNQGARRLVAFAAGLGADRQDRLILAFAGLLEKFDTLRDFLIGGVRDFVLRAKILREAIDRNQRAAAALPADGGAAVEAQRRDYLEAGFWDARRMDDALEEAEFLCHRYAYLEEKLRRLANVVRSEL
jgi:hypothetical protein